MILFPSKCHDWLNYRPQDVDRRFGRAMLNPHYRSVSVYPDAEVLVDSGAFQKKDMLDRLPPWLAFKRQREFEFDKRQEGGRPWRYVHYDCLRGVDEAIVEREGGKADRVKKRGSEETAAPAVAETLRSAAYYASRADDVEGGLAYSAQGATFWQYMGCVMALMDFIRPGVDWLALGGFCIIGMNRSLVPLFLQVCEAVAPLCRRAGVEQVHVLGVAFPDALVPAAAYFRRDGVRFSTDTSGFETQAVMGKVWHERNIGDCSGRRRGGPYLHEFKKEHKHNSMSPTPPGCYNPGELHVQNLERFIAWATPL